MFGGVFAHHMQFLESAAELRARSDGVFDQQHQLAELQTFRSGRDAFEEVQDALLDGLAFVIAGMRDQIFGADGDGAFQLAAESLDGLRRTLSWAEARLIR